ncbi:MAG: ATP-binding protein [Velocimicrobium sp.]
MKQTALVLLIFLLLQFIIGFALFQHTAIKPLDTVSVNEIVQSVSKQWNDLQLGNAFLFPNLTTSIDYAVISTDGSLLATTNKTLSITQNEAIAHRDTILDITYNMQTVGKIIIYNNQTSRFYKNLQTLFILFLSFSCLELLLLFFYILYLNQSIFYPFHKLKNFATRVAGGDLDFPLEMDKVNAFGAFTESFDLMREELKKAREQERIATQSKKELVAKLSHDIKTPVASIQAIAELMELTATTKKEQNQLTVIQNKAKQIDSLISNLFQATLEELSELAVLPKEHESRILQELLAIADYQCRATIEDIPDCIVIFDTLRLQQVFDNILGNSYKYANTPIHISYSLDNNNLCIYIKDFGPGIKSNELPLVFEKFYRGENAREKGGTGLGLFISNYLLKEMEAAISCENLADGFVIKVSLVLASFTKLRID